ncbi:MAG: class I SAM-dependent methyltransferase, partial [Nitrosarchaeum sp.]|nr:class I SAM-dependent methyltransferase [Nitrosarchaeum sp.]
SDFAKFGCKEIIAMDLGTQVFEARKLTKHLPHVHCIQGDLMNPPFKEGVLDVIASHGVLHHLPSPREGFLRLSKLLKIGGMMAIYVYHKEWQYFKTHKKSLLWDWLYATGTLVWLGIRKVTSRLPHPLLFLWVYLMAIKSTVESLAEKLWKPAGSALRMIPPFAYIGVNFHERLVRNYDHYSATFNYFHSVDEVVDWFAEGAFDQVEIVSVPVSIRAWKTEKVQKPLTIRQWPYLQHFAFRQEWERLYSKRR